MIFFTNFGVLDGMDGTTRGPFIFIRPEHKDNAALIAHEKVHRWQWIRTLGLHSFLYLFSQRYRLNAEIEAYKEQLKYMPSSLASFAHLISTKYDVTVTAAEISAMLKE